MSVNTQGLNLALVTAVETNNVTTVIDLIKKGVDVNKRRPLPLTPLMIAAGRGYVQMTQTLLDAGADVNVIDSVTGASPLHKGYLPYCCAGRYR